MADVRRDANSLRPIRKSPKSAAGGFNIRGGTGKGTALLFIGLQGARPPFLSAGIIRKTAISL